MTPLESGAAAARPGESGGASDRLQQPEARADKPQELGTAEQPQELGSAPEKPEELGAAAERGQAPDGPPEPMGSPLAEPAAAAADRIPRHFHAWFWGFAALSALLLALYYWRMDGEQLEILRELVSSVVPLGVLTVVVLAVILFGITTATESAAVGARVPCTWRCWRSTGA